MPGGHAARGALVPSGCNALFSTWIGGYRQTISPPFRNFIATMTRNADGEIVQFDNVGLRFGTDREVLSDVSFTLYPGSFYFLTGASGAGKTSLLRLLYLAQRPSRGAIRMFGQRCGYFAARTVARRSVGRIGVVFQDFRLVPHLSAFDNIALPLRIAGASERDLRPACSARCSNWIGLDRTGRCSRLQRCQAENSSAWRLRVR